MILLTWPTKPSAAQVKAALKKLRRLWRERWGESMDAWLMEMHKSGVPHFHLFVAQDSAFGSACESSPTREVVRRGRKTIIVGGSVERWLVGAWLESIDEIGNVAALAFNRGGIIERVRSHDAAGRYVAKESCKREQKVLPDCYSSGLGRWWWLNPLFKPRVREVGDLDETHWPHAGPMKHVWQAEAIKAALIPSAPAPARLLPSGRIYLLQKETDAEAATAFFIRGARRAPPEKGTAWQRTIAI